MAVKILIENNKSRLVAERKTLIKVRERFKIKSPGAWFSPQYHKWTRDADGAKVRVWDGYVKYISEVNGLFSTGLLDQLCGHLDKLGINYELEDQRERFKHYPLGKSLGNLEFRDYQISSINSVFDNKFKNIKYQRGILAEATNSGKSLIAAGIFASLHPKRIGFFLVNNTTLFEQAVADLEALLPGEVGYVSSKKTKLKRVNVCMVQTLGNRLKDPLYKTALAKADAMLVDEADEIIGRKDAKACLATAFNATIRIALSGTPLMSKDKTRNQELLAYFGPILHRTSNKELVEKGVSTPPDIRIYLGNNEFKGSKGDYAEEYNKAIVRNRRRHKRIWKLVSKFAAKNKLPILILFKEHYHARSIYKCIPDTLQHLSVKIVHGETKGRAAIFKEFNAGKIDVLIASMIIRRGKNLPLIKVLMNAAGGTSEANVLQIFGRALRSHASKKKVIVVDFWDMGVYLNKHSKRRVRYYEKQGFEVKLPYKKQLQKLDY